MKWILFTGTWRLTNEEVENDVRQAVREVISRGDGVLTGGATGVDYYAMDEAFKLQPSATHIRIIIPATLEAFIQDYEKNWCQDPVTHESIKALSDLLHNIKAANPARVINTPAFAT